MYIDYKQQLYIIQLKNHIYDKKQLIYTVKLLLGRKTFQIKDIQIHKTINEYKGQKHYQLQGHKQN